MAGKCTDGSMHHTMHIFLTLAHMVLQEVDDLITSCMDPDPNIRPSGSEIVRQLSRQLDKLASDSSEGPSETKS